MGQEGYKLGQLREEQRDGGDSRVVATDLGGKVVRMESARAVGGEVERPWMLLDHVCGGDGWACQHGEGRSCFAAAACDYALRGWGGHRDLMRLRWEEMRVNSRGATV
ncbi:hypothetical protein SESBI_37713 [Sesbania bispinosa]|nr:hypothetical protein SESBI_37713 [Sesbania bispinosa]